MLSSDNNRKGTTQLDAGIINLLMTIYYIIIKPEELYSVLIYYIIVRDKNSQRCTRIVRHRFLTKENCQN